ncbi:CehA/McbA family metallohydrolase [Pelagicoccus sp. SDUM812003]|nr:CehA/McbA family metallohydrolase [Pelagicoccus sp. SDUM812003]
MYNFYLPPAPSSTPWAPAWHPDGSAITVGMSGSIWNVDPSSGVATELTRSETYHSSPDWSPDGRWLVYVANDGEKTIQLELLDTESGKVTKLTDDEHLYLDPVFSPDGSKLAYVSNQPSGYFNVFVRSLGEGAWQGEAIPITYDNSYANSRLYFGEWDMHISPTWTPNGEFLLLVSNRDVPLGSGNVLKVPAEERGIDRADTVLREQTLYRTKPDVSIDGKRFVYASTSGAADQFNNLYVQPVDGGYPYKLTFLENDAFHPRWSPDGEWIAYIDNRDGLPQLALLETYGGKNKVIEITERNWKEPMATLKLRTVDEDTGKLMGTRALITASDGKFYAPSDAYARIGRAGDRVFHHEGVFEVDLPAGKTELYFVRGFEYEPEKLELSLAPGEVLERTVTLNRFADLEKEGWYSGSTHSHVNYGANLLNSLENLMMMTSAEDADIAVDQIANKDNRVLDYHFFEPGGKEHSSSRDDVLVVAAQEYRPPFWGHVFMIGLEEHLISPYLTGYEATGVESLYPSNTDMFRKAKRQGALTGFVHPFSGESDPLQGKLGHGKAFMVDAALGTTDALEWSRAQNSGFFPLYSVWNNGLRVAAVGGEDSLSDLHQTALIATMRTFAYLGDQEMTLRNWLEAIRKGHVFVSNGPLMDMTIEGKLPGQQIDLERSGNSVTLKASVESIVPLETFYLIQDGEVIEEIAFDGDRRSLQIEREIEVSQSGWIHVKAQGSSDERFPLDARYAQGFTNPVWIEVAGQPIRDAASAQYSLDWIDKLETMALEWPDWRSQKEIDHVLSQFEEAREIYRTRMKEDQASKALATK